MKFRVLAMDYDGTIAEQGKLHPEVRAAIRDARHRGLLVVLVTGRILEDLRDRAGDLRLFNMVVAENGAVATAPESGRSLVLGPPPTPELLDALRRRGVAYSTGSCVVEAESTAAHAVLDAIRETELPLTIVFNRGRLMVLPQGISKATGLRYALRMMRESEHNTIAIGDAENDHALLEACEVSMAVGWGSPILMAAADQVLPGVGPPDVAPFIRRLPEGLSLRVGRDDRHAVTLGHTLAGDPLSLSLRGRNVLVVGDPRSGKSWVAGLVAEQLILQRYCVCVIDPEGDYQPLQGLPGVVVLGGDDPPPRAQEVWSALRYPDVSVVIDLSKLGHEEKRTYVAMLMPLLQRLRQHTGLPHWLLVDEAHYFLGGPTGVLPPDFDQGGYLLVTYRADELPRNALRHCHTIVATRVTDRAEIARLLGEVGSPEEQEEWAAALPCFSTREAAVLRGLGAEGFAARRFRVAYRLTAHVRHRQKYVDVQVPAWLAFTFTLDGTATGLLARTMREFAAAIEEVPAEVLDGHLRRGDFSRWVAGVFGDHSLARQLDQVEELYALGQAANVRDALVQRIEARYGASELTNELRPRASPPQPTALEATPSA